jgi:hypothetical protein
VDALTSERPFFQATPNPLAHGTRLSFRLPAAADVRVTIHDARGRRVATLLDGPRSAGRHAVRWNARDASNARVAAGVYFAALSDGAGVRAQKLVVIQ